MKAEMDRNGVITLVPETSVEAYALKQWYKTARVEQQDLRTIETHHYRGSHLKIDFVKETAS